MLGLAILLLATETAYIILTHRKIKKLKIDEPKRRILKLLAQHNSLNILQIESKIQLKRYEIEFHLTNLAEFKYILISYPTGLRVYASPNPDEDTTYSLLQKGREYVVKSP